jgi:hypothetical protein
MKFRWMLLTFSVAIVSLFPPLTLAQRQLMATHDDILAAPPNGGQIARWTNNRLAGCEPCQGSPVLVAIDSRGAEKFVHLDIPGAGYTAVYDVAASSDGSLAAVGLAMSDDSRMGTFVAWISGDQSRQVITRLWPYGANVLTIAPDGTIWMIGSVLTDTHVSIYPNVLRHYTPSGQLLSSNIVMRARKSQGGLYEVGPSSALMASNDRIGWLTAACQYLEFSFDGAELGRYNCPDSYSDITQLGGVAMSSANDLLIGTKPAAELAPLELDRATGSWKPVPVLKGPGKALRLLGFDGLTLVTSAWDKMNRYALSGQPTDRGR